MIRVNRGSIRLLAGVLPAGLLWILATVLAVISRPAILHQESPGRVIGAMLKLRLSGVDIVQVAVSSPRFLVRSGGIRASGDTLS